MTAARRWWCVGIGVLLLVATPLLVRSRPASDEDVTALALLHRVQESRDVQFAGYAQSAGAVGLPGNEELSGLADLLGGTNQVRVWWRDPSTWRVSTLRPTGETDLVHTGHRMLRWVYESRDVTLVPDVAVRLPNTVDLLPNELARRVLAGARPVELSRLPARRVAGRDALGLRLRPADEQASIGRVDVYADRASGLPVLVQLFSRGSATPALTSRFLDLSVRTPSSAELAFRAPQDAYLRNEDVIDLADAANRFAARIPPDTLAGLPSRPVRPESAAPVFSVPGSAGVYGRGPTVLLALPLWSRTAQRVHEDLQSQPGVQTLDEGLLVAAPPVRLLLANAEPNDSSWLLAGTVTRRALRDAARQLSEHRPGLMWP